jgi:Prokaryotic E2 family E
MRRQFLLPEQDIKFLEDYGLPWETIKDGAHWSLVHNFPLPNGYNHENVTAAIRMETGYPNTPLDMVYFYPLIARVDGKSIGAATVVQQIDGKNFQRWSRHRSASNPWVPGQDDLFSHVTLVEDWLIREFEK